MAALRVPVWPPTLSSEVTQGMEVFLWGGGCTNRPETGWEVHNESSNEHGLLQAAPKIGSRKVISLKAGPLGIELLGASQTRLSQTPK